MIYCDYTKSASEGTLVKEYHPLFEQSDDLTLWVVIGSIRDDVVCHTQNRLRFDDDVIHYLRVYSNLSFITYCRGLGGSV